MTKGKYATRATLRREDDSVRSEIGSYQHHVKRQPHRPQALTLASLTNAARAVFGRSEVSA